MAAQHKPTEDNSEPSIVLIGVPTQKALRRVIRKLEANNIHYTTFDEPDWDLGLTAVATIPLNYQKRSALRDYAIWREPKGETHVSVSEVA